MKNKLITFLFLFLILTGCSVTDEEIDVGTADEETAKLLAEEEKQREEYEELQERKEEEKQKKEEEKQKKEEEREKEDSSDEELNDSSQIVDDSDNQDDSPLTILDRAQIGLDYYEENFPRIVVDFIEDAEAYGVMIRDDTMVSYMFENPFNPQKPLNWDFFIIALSISHSELEEHDADFPLIIYHPFDRGRYITKMENGEVVESIFE